MLVRSWGLETRLDDYWNEQRLGSIRSCKKYFKRLLQQINSSLTLGLDNVDRVFEYPELAKDFLPMLRNWHEEANNLDAWQRLRLVIAHSTEIYIKLDINQSPFNVGLPVRLPGFELKQVESLAQRYKLDGVIAGEGQHLTSLQKMLGGHPYLIQQAFDALKHEKVKLEQLLQEAPTQGGIYGAHLRHHWSNLQQQPELAEAMKQVVTADGLVQLEPILAYKLESMGLVTLKGNKVMPSCELYYRYFREHL